VGAVLVVLVLGLEVRRNKSCIAAIGLCRGPLEVLQLVLALLLLVLLVGRVSCWRAPRPFLEAGIEETADHRSRPLCSIQLCEFKGEGRKKRPKKRSERDGMKLEFRETACG